MEAGIARLDDASFEDDALTAEAKPPGYVHAAAAGPATDGDPPLDVDREAFELARIRGADGAAVVEPLAQFPSFGRLADIDWAAVARRTVDITAASLLLLVLAPLLATIALAVRLDSRGPALFRQRRLGRDRAPFTMYKFRTMRADADSGVHERYMRQQLEDGGHAAVSEDGRQIFKPWPDHRVTRVGSFLRSWSLDELPNLLNVLRGEMSLVGFRPPIPYEVECYPDWYHERFAVQPGITGLWQVSGRNEKSYEEMIELDIEYARARTWKMDLVVLLKTLGAVVRRHGAY